MIFVNYLASIKGEKTCERERKGDTNSQDSRYERIAQELRKHT